MSHVLRIPDEQGAELLGPLEAKPLHLGRYNRRLPLKAELLLRDRTTRIPRADHHQIRARSVPKRAVLEHVAERVKDRFRADIAEVGERQPVGDEAAFSKPAANQLEVLARIQILDARNAR